MNVILTMAATASLIVPRVDLGPAPDIRRVDSLLDSGGFALHEIGVVNWPDRSPDRPEVRFRIAHSGDEIYIKYYVNESALRAVYDTDGNRPWQESCVEFFVSPGEADDPVYYNIEMSCIGYGILQGGAPGSDRAMMPEGVAGIRRLPSLPREPFGIREGVGSAQGNREGSGEFSWTLTLAIPVEVFALSPVAPLSGRTLGANFYKCGDLLPRPHWVSWSPIVGDRPTFHSPASFGRLFFE